ncbi:MAG TPA: cation:proton antiporter, partial [Acidimicrobiales bacterium]|nr:cation:proton antiporter [Acidimicrobiales bacterium]
PVVVERLGIPGIVGLLIGGFVIGPHGLGAIGSGNQTVPQLGQLGLLYLMFVAGLELDLGVLAANRRTAFVFALITFTLPFAGGLAVGSALGWELPASLLLGSLLASHTLITYPIFREAGRAADRGVATAVGATVLTDTLALVVLAGVSGSETGSGSTAVVLGEILLGLVVLGVAGLWALPRLALYALRAWGGDRAARYMVAVVSFLALAVLAEVFGIEGIVGAFVAGLALNRLVPNEGPSMDRIEFFGSAVFIPVFLVSVGLLLDPSVMFSAETLRIAGLIVAACMGGKAIAVLIARPLLGFTPPEAGAAFALTSPQAAATLAATLVGFDIGLFGTTVVNAVLVLILVSITVSTLVARRYAARLPPPERDAGALGRRVLLATRRGGPSPGVVAVVDRLARPDGGVVDVVVVHVEGEDVLPPAEARALERRLFRGALDGSVRCQVSSVLPRAVTMAALSTEPSLVVVEVGADDDAEYWAEGPALADSAPVVLVYGEPPHRPHRVTVEDPTATGTGAVAEIAARLGRRVVPAAGHTEPGRGEVVVRALASWDALDGIGVPAAGALLAVLPALDTLDGG